MLSTQTHTLTKTQQEIIKALLYFDVFNYPLKQQEILESCSVKLSKTEFHDALQELVETNTIKHSNGFYFAFEVNATFIKNRLSANELAQRKLIKAYRYSKKIASFPFMQGICISGGLSKNYYDEKSDIDYFVITKANRLWICRTLFTLFYKTLPKHKREYYCLNYFISEADLVIPDQNHFVATELAHLIPTVNYSSYVNVLNSNAWYKRSFPNKDLYPNIDVTTTPKPLLKKIFETLFSGVFGNWMDDKLLAITLRHWLKKHPHLSEHEFNLQLRSKKHVCKHHLKGHQNKVLALWEEKIKLFENESLFKVS